MSKIAIYTANFGNYRREKIKLNNIQIVEDIDYYFFTDDEKIESKKWNIIIRPLEPKTECMNAARHTSKHVKFITPELIDKYDIIIWIDNKAISDKIKLNTEKIVDLFETNPGKECFFIKHDSRKHAKEEIGITIKMKIENKEAANIFLEKVKDITFDLTLPDTYCFIYKNTIENKQLLQNVYEGLLEHGLKRDQNIIQYIWKTNNYEDKIAFFELKSILSTGM
jgi:hypothetical protein